MTARPAKVDLVSLPAELHHEIVRNLQYPAVQQLRSTNRYFYYLLSEESLTLIKQQFIDELVQEDLLDRELHNAWEVSSPYFYPVQGMICFMCFRKRPFDAFQRTQKTKRRSLGGREACKRFCTACGVRAGRWQPGIFIKCRGGGVTYCTNCKTVAQTAAWARAIGLCLRCWDATRRTVTAEAEKLEVGTRVAINPIDDGSGGGTPDLLRARVPVESAPLD